MKRMLFVALLAIVAVSCKQQAKDTGDNTELTDLSGAGATFPLPYYNVLFKNYSTKTSANVTYGGIGSGGGIRSLKDKTVDFGATDAFLSEKELQEMEGEILHIPSCIGAVVLAYNLPEVKDLKLNGALISDIFLGKIKKWNDEKIKSLNPGAALPDRSITAVYRSDGSGTTYVFSDYLTKTSPEWAEKMGTGKALKWETGIAAKGNPGVAGTIQQTTGAIGYIGSEYALALKIPSASLQNKAGKFVEPNTASISAAANVELPADLRVMITDSPDENAYPISCLTWIIVYKEQAYGKRKEVQAQSVVNLLRYIVSDEAQAMAEKVHYSPLPPAALENARQLVATITYNQAAVDLSANKE